MHSELYRTSAPDLDASLSTSMSQSASTHGHSALSSQGSVAYILQLLKIICNTLTTAVITIIREATSPLVAVMAIVAFEVIAMIVVIV